MIRDSAEAVWIRFRTEGVDLRAAPSTKERRASVQNITSRCEEAEIEASNADDDWDLEKMVFVDEAEASGVRNKLKKIQWLCQDEEEAVPTSVVEVIEPFWEAVEMKRNNTKLGNRINGLERELEDVW